MNPQKQGVVSGLTCTNRKHGNLERPGKSRWSCRPKRKADALEAGYDAPARYVYWNALLFGNQLPVVPLTWIEDGPWLTFTRYSSPESIEIFLSKAFLPTFEQRDDALLLEMLHLYIRHVVLDGKPESDSKLFELFVKKAGEERGYELPSKVDLNQIPINPAVPGRDVGLILVRTPEKESFVAFFPDRLWMSHYEKIVRNWKEYLQKPYADEEFLLGITRTPLVMKYHVTDEATGFNGHELLDVELRDLLASPFTHLNQRLQRR
jgi:hypothetical protein